MEALSFFVGVVGNVISVLVFASPMTTFRRIIRRRSTEDFESIPYICTLLSSLLWTYYGITKPGGLLVATVNGVGILLEAIYVTLFLIFASWDLRVKTAVLVVILDVVFFGGVVLITRLAIDDSELRILMLGVICSCFSMFMYGSPLAAMKKVVDSKSVEYMPFFLSFFLFLNGGIWTLYAALVNDIFLGIPNGIGFILGTAQLIIYAIYMNPKVLKQEKEDEEEGWQHQCLIQPDEVLVIVDAENEEEKEG